MWLVALALRRPHTFVVMAILMVILGVLTIVRMPTDMFPVINIPVIAVAWNYTGISAEEMEQRIVTNFERLVTITVNDIEHMESQSLSGIGVIKIFLQPGANIEGATAQITAASQTILRNLPPGTQPPLVIRYSASNVPAVQIALGSDTLDEQQLFDICNFYLRNGLVTVKGAQIPFPYGGKQRLVMVDLEPDRLRAYGLSAADISEALNAQSLVLPAGTAKMGDREYAIRLNSSPDLVRDFNDLPIRTVNGRVVFLRDVAHVRDGYSPQTNMVHVDGRKGTLLTILKSADSSTLDLVQTIRERLPEVVKTIPGKGIDQQLRLSLLFDQSVFVRAAVSGVVKEAAIAAFLTGLMILLFLGSWRSTLIVVISIPLSILTAIMALKWLGETLNVMTLGGMALAVGILVDDATVTIENIHRNLGERKPLRRAIMDGARQIAVPAFVSTLCICIVFVPVVFITGAARSLFTPMALAVVFAMLTSYFLSRTLVPTLIQGMLAREAAYHGPPQGFGGRFHAGFDRGFAALQAFYGRILAWTLMHRWTVMGLFAIFLAVSMALLPFVGRDFFPTVDAGQLRLHVRCPPGTRIEATERWFARVQDQIRAVIPAEELGAVIDNIGIPYSSINLTLGDPSLVSPADGEILIALKEGHGPCADYTRQLRRRLTEEFPGAEFFFLAPDISSQVLNFGLSAPIDIQITGPVASLAKNQALARRIRSELAAVPGAVDVHLHQVTAAPVFQVEVDRTQAQLVGMSQRDVASSMLISLSGSMQTAPNFWLDANRGAQYAVMVQAPQNRIDSLTALGSLPLAPRSGDPQILANLAQVRRSTAPVNLTHNGAMPTVDVLANVDGVDLGTVSRAVDGIVARVRGDLPGGSTIQIRGQVESMNSSFRNLGIGLGFSILLVYLLLVVNFQSWKDPVIILSALPGALAGIIWALYACHTTFSVPALMGAIMSVGVATANSILVVSFAKDLHEAGMGETETEAAWRAGLTRLRPVLMTAAAMIIGMLPMALGLSEGGEQNAPLGRAVIGGLVAATMTTLLVVPVAYGALHRRRRVTPAITAANTDEGSFP